MDSVVKAHRCEPPRHTGGNQVSQNGQNRVGIGRRSHGRVWAQTALEVLLTETEKPFNGGGWHWSAPRSLNSQGLWIPTAFWSLIGHMRLQLSPCRWTGASWPWIGAWVQTLVLASMWSVRTIHFQVPWTGSWSTRSVQGLGLACSVCGLCVEGMWWGGVGGAGDREGRMAFIWGDGSRREIISQTWLG